MTKPKWSRLISFLLSFMLLFGNFAVNGVNVYAANGEGGEIWSEITSEADLVDLFDASYSDKTGPIDAIDLSDSIVDDPVALQSRLEKISASGILKKGLTERSYKDKESAGIVSRKSTAVTASEIEYVDSEKAYIESVIEMLAEPVGAVGFEDAKLSGGTIDVIVWLQELPKALYNKYGAANAASAAPYMADGTRARQTIRSSMSRKVICEYSEVFAGFGMKVSASEIDQLANMKGVYAVTPDTLMHETSFTADPDYNLTGMSDSRKVLEIGDIHAAGITGENVVVGVLDTGIDFNHPDFEGVYKGGWNYIKPEVDYGRPAEIKDKPMETTYEQWRASKQPEANTSGKLYYTSHGSHVSGTIAAQGKNGEAATLGIAPDVELYVARVLGPYGSGATTGIIEAIDDFAKGNAARGIPKADVINLSLGADQDTAYGADVYALNNAVIAGVNVAVSAGNNAGASMLARSNYTLGTPGTAYLPVTVAASQYGGATLPVYMATASNGTKTDVIPLLTEGRNDSNSFDDDRISGSPSPDYDDTNGYTVYLAFGTGDGPSLLTDLQKIANGSLSGKILALKRGDMSFTDMLAQAKRLDAGALIIANSTANGDEFVQGITISGVLSDNIPILTTYSSSSAKLTALANGSNTVYLTLGTLTNKIQEKMPANFSSIGPVTETAGIKPDIIAPGVDIISTQPAYITSATHDAEDYTAAYAAMGGTSMSAPHIAGILALMKQKYPDASPAEIKARLMNTADTTLIKALLDGTPASVFEVGAGFVDPKRAILEDTKVYITVQSDIPGKANGDIIANQTLSSLSFGYVGAGENSSVIPVTVHNASATAAASVIYNNDTRYSNDASENGVKLHVDFSDGQSESTFDAWIEIPETAETGEYEGYLKISVDGHDYTLPWAVYVGEPPVYFDVLAFAERPIVSTGTSMNEVSAASNNPIDSRATTLWFTWEGAWPTDSGGYSDMDIYLLNADTLDAAYYYGFISLNGTSNDGSKLYRVTNVISNTAFSVTNGAIDSSSRKTIDNGAYILGIVAGDELYGYTDLGVVFSNGKGNDAVTLEVDAYVDNGATKGTVYGRVYSPALARAQEYGLIWTEVDDFWYNNKYYDIDQSFNILAYSSTTSSVYYRYNLLNYTGAVSLVYLLNNDFNVCNEEGYFELEVPLGTGNNASYPFTTGSGSTVNHAIVGVEGFYWNDNGTATQQNPYVYMIGANKSAAQTPQWKKTGILSDLTLENGKLTATINSETAATLTKDNFKLRFDIDNATYEAQATDFNYVLNGDVGTAEWTFTPIDPLQDDQVLHAVLTYGNHTLEDVITIEGADKPKISPTNQAFDVLSPEDVAFGIDVGYGIYGATKIESIECIGYSGSNSDNAVSPLFEAFDNSETTSGASLMVSLAVNADPVDVIGTVLTDGSDYAQTETKLTINKSFLREILLNENDCVELLVTFDNTKPTPVSETVTITAAYILANVTFDSNEGSPVESICIDYDSPVEAPLDPIRNGYRFDGWYLDNGTFNDRWDFNTPVTSNITLFAKWIKLYTVTFSSNGGTTVQPKIVDEGSTVSEPAEPIRDGYKFVGWFSEDGKQWNFSSNTVSRDLSLTARWLAIFNVKFNAKGGSVVESQNVLEGENIIKPADPTRTGYTFGGWYTDDETFQQPWDFAKGVNNNITLFAKWIIITYTVTFETNNGSSIASAIVDHGSKVIKPADPTRNGYTFEGWYANQGLTTPWNFSANAITSNTTLYASWKAIEIEPTPTPTPTPKPTNTQRPSGGGSINDNNGGNSGGNSAGGNDDSKSGSATETPATPKPTVTPTEAPTQTPQPTVNLISNEDVSNAVQAAIQQAAADNTAPVTVIVIGENESGLTLSGENLMEQASLGGELVVSNGIFETTYTQQQIEEWGLSEGTEVVIILTPSNVAINEDVSAKLTQVDEINAVLLQEVYDIAIMTNGDVVTETIIPTTVTIDVSEMNLTPEQMANFTGFVFDETTQTYRQLGGEFSEDGKTFTFYTYETGTHGVMVSEDLTKIHLEIGNNEYTQNGEVQESDVSPFIAEDNRTMMPLRVIAEALGASVGWDPETASVTLTKDGITLTFAIDEPLPDGMGTATIVDGRAFVPIRYIAEMLGANVVWDADNGAVNIYQ